MKLRAHARPCPLHMSECISDIIQIYKMCFNNVHIGWGCICDQLYNNYIFILCTVLLLHK